MIYGDEFMRLYGEGRIQNFFTRRRTIQISYEDMQRIMNDDDAEDIIIKEMDEFGIEKNPHSLFDDTQSDRENFRTIYQEKIISFIRAIEKDLIILDKLNTVLEYRSRLSRVIIDLICIIKDIEDLSHIVINHAPQLINVLSLNTIANFGVELCRNIPDYDILQKISVGITYNKEYTDAIMKYSDSIGLPIK